MEGRSNTSQWKEILLAKISCLIVAGDLGIDEKIVFVIIVSFLPLSFHCMSQYSMDSKYL